MDSVTALAAHLAEPVTTTTLALIVAIWASPKFIHGVASLVWAFRRRH